MISKTVDNSIKHFENILKQLRIKIEKLMEEERQYENIIYIIECNLLNTLPSNDI